MSHRNSNNSVTTEDSIGTYENGEVDQLEESGSENELQPPPVPPRSHSLSPSPSQGSYNDLFNGAGRVDIYGSNSSLENGSGPFLGEGRGGGKVSPPLQMEETETPPPLPAKTGRRRSFQPPKNLQDIEEEEKALISELDELEKLVSRDSSEFIQTYQGPVDIDSQTKVNEMPLANGSVPQTKM